MGQPLCQVIHTYYRIYFSQPHEQEVRIYPFYRWESWGLEMFICPIRLCSWWTSRIAGIHIESCFSFELWASLVAQRVKCLPAMRETLVPSLGWEDPLEKEMETTPVLLPGKIHGWRSLQATVHGVVKSWTWLNNFTFTFFLSWYVSVVFSHYIFIEQCCSRHWDSAVSKIYNIPRHMKILFLWKEITEASHTIFPKE